MSGPSTSTSRKVRDPSRKNARGRVQDYLHAVTDDQAACVCATGDCLQEIKRQTGAVVIFDNNRSSVPGMKIVNIRGETSQMEQAVKLINLKTGNKVPLSEQAQTFWLQWLEAAFPDLDSRAYFLPPVYVNRVPMTRQSIGGKHVLVLTSDPGLPAPTITSGPQPLTVQDSDIREDEARHRVHLCLQEMFERNREVVIGLSKLKFGQYLGESCYTAAVQLPIPSNLPPSLPRNWKEGDFDLLLIHRHYGLVVCDVRAFAGNIVWFNMSETDKIIRKKLARSISQLDKAEAMLSHLVSDVAPGLRITKTIVVPNLTAHQVQEAITGDKQLTEDLCRCLGTSDPADITGLCLCSDQLSDPMTPWDVSSHVLGELGHWWQRRVAGAGPDSHMTSALYKLLVSRFCGPATTVTVPCTFPPRLSVKTLEQAVSVTGECYTAVITLFPEQLHLLNTAPSRMFLCGPPGTGKTVVLLLMGNQWLRCGHQVFLLSAWYWSRASCLVLYHLLLQLAVRCRSTGATPGQSHLLFYDFDEPEEVDKAVNELSHAASSGSLHIIADESGPVVSQFHSFCEELLRKVPRLHLWAASVYQGDPPAGWQVEYLTRPLRCPPAVTREVQQDWMINGSCVPRYSERGVPDYSEGPPVKRLYHQGEGHLERSMEDCTTCGREVARFLHSLRVRDGDTTITSTRGELTPPPPLQWRDVLVLCWRPISDELGLVVGLIDAGIPVRVMEEDDDVEDVATARSDVVWLVEGRRVIGLERKVIVCLQNDDDYVRLYFMSRCTSQLVVVSRD